MKTKFLGLILFLIMASGAGAQRVKYGELLLQLDGMSLESQKNALKEYLAVEQDHPNGNLRLGLLYQRMYRQADPLTDYEYVLATAEQAMLRFLKAKRLIDEKEMVRNDEQYFSIYRTLDAKGKPSVSLAQVSATMNNGYDSARIHMAKLPPIYRNFTRTVAFYDKAVKSFADISQRYLSLDDLYLYYDEKLDKQLQQLRADYDSARSYFDAYKALIAEYPIQAHKQTYHIRLIVTFRLDGLLTRMNFLTNDVELWDYASWTESVRKHMQNEIAGLRQRIASTDQRLSGTLARFQAREQGVVPFRPDKQLVYKINEYDRQSVLLALFEYQSFKQDWLSLEWTAQRDTSGADRSAELHSQLLYANLTADTLLTELKSRIVPEKVRKHAALIDQRYQGQDGLVRYQTTEQANVMQTRDRYTAELRSALLTKVAHDTVREALKTIRFANRWNLVTRPGKLDRLALDKGEPVTLQNVHAPDGGVYLAGVYKPDKKANQVMAFVAHVTPDGKAAWMQNYGFKIDSTVTVPDADSYPGALVRTQEGCAVVIHTVHRGGQRHMNTMIYLNEKGEEKFKHKMKDADYPRSLRYVERSNTFVMLLKGQSDTTQFVTPEPLKLVSVNALGDLLWKQEWVLTGNAQELVSLSDGYLVVGNYAQLRDPRGREFKTRAGEANPFLIRFTLSGTFQRTVAIPAERAVYMTNTYKVSENAIHVLGVESTLSELSGKNVLTAPRVMHLMVDQNGKIIHANF